MAYLHVIAAIAMTWSVFVNYFWIASLFQIGFLVYFASVEGFRLTECTVQSLCNSRMSCAIQSLV